MNTYNDNLRSTVLNTLSDQELELTNLNAAFVTSEVTLYYAQGAAARADYKLKRANEEYDSTKEIFDTIVVDSSISANVKTDANTFRDANALAVTNMAVAAANVQASANAILRLARTTAGIYSITRAADFGQDICAQSKLANSLMTTTAYNAELASEKAMNASAAIAEVASATVATDAKTTDDQITALEKSITDNFTNAAAEVDARSNELATAIDQEKLAEGTVEISDEQYFAAKGAYTNSNNNLNLGLQAQPQDESAGKSILVTFNAYTSPFPDVNKKTDYPVTHGPVIATGYPVETYYIMVAKNRVKSTFSLAEAEAVIGMDNRSVSIGGSLRDQIAVPIPINQLLDTDGDKIKLGADYVVFVLAVFRIDYKKIINNFDDFLSAPSEKFFLANYLVNPAHDVIKVSPSGNVLVASKDIKFKEPVTGGEVDVDIEGEVSIEYKPYSKKQKLNFSVNQKPEFQVEYRCMFLPANTLPRADMMSTSGIRDWVTENNAHDKIREKFSVKLNELNTKIAAIMKEIEKLNDTIHDKKRKAEELAIEISKFPKKLTPEEKEKKAKLEEKLSNLEAEISGLREKAVEQKGKHELLSSEMITVRATQDAELRKPIRLVNADPGLLFNLKIAELVPESIYELAKEIACPPELTQIKDNTKCYELALDTTMTDNFGNPLRKDDYYVPVILAVATGEPSYTSQFINALSDFTNTTQFRYLGA